MSKKVSPTLVGSFVILGAAATVVTVLLLGSGNLFSTKIPFVLYFDESVNGLQKGAPVKFKGVTIGEVREILLHYERGNNEIRIPVIIHLNANTIMDNLSVPLHAGQEAAYVDLVNHLVGKLETDSFVTGRLFIGLRYDPLSDSKRQLEASLQYPEIPTEPSSLAALTDQLGSIDIAGLAERAREVLEQVNKGLAELQFDRLNEEAVGVLAAARKRIEGLPIDQSLAAFNDTMAATRRTLASIEKTSDELRQLSGSARGEIKPLATGLDRTVGQATTAMREIEKTAAELRTLLSPVSPAHIKLVRAMEELALLSRSLRELSDTLNRHPRMLLTGRPDSETPRK